MTIKNWIDVAGEITIVVQSCWEEGDTGKANIMVFVGRNIWERISGGFMVDVPSLKRNSCESQRPFQLSHVDFDVILQEHRDAVLGLLKRLVE